MLPWGRERVESCAFNTSPVGGYVEVVANNGTGVGRGTVNSGGLGQVGLGWVGSGWVGWGGVGLGGVGLDY